MGCFWSAPSPPDTTLLSAEDRLFRAIVNYAAAAAAGAIVQQAIRDGADVNAVRDGTTPLMLACEEGSDCIVGILLDAGSDAWWRDSHGWSAIFWACHYRHLSTVQLLINHDSGLLETVDGFGCTPLFHAIIQQGHLSTVQLLLHDSGLLELRSNIDSTPLFRAIDGRHSDIVQFLLDSGADPHHVDKFGRTALMIACQNDSLEIVRLLLAAGVDVEARDEEQQTALILACKRGCDQIIRILLDAGADTRWKDSNGCSAIWMACFHGHLSTVQLLIHHEHGLLEIVDNLGWKPLIVAIRRQHSDIVRFLVDSGADPHHVDEYGQTPLMIACQEDGLESVRLLLAAGVDMEACDEEQQTALHHAAYHGYIEVVRELVLQHNANMFAMDVDGRTPFDAACRSWRGDAAVNNLLEVYGNKLTQDHGRLALHKLLQVAKYSFAEDVEFHPPLNPLRIFLPLGKHKLTLTNLRTVQLHTLDPDLIRNRDDTGKLPIHIACQTNAPVEVLVLISELDPAAFRIADSTGALPIHLLCGNTPTADYASVRYLVDQGGVGTLAACNRQGLLPLHVLCGSTNPSLRIVQYLIQSFPGSLAVQTNAGQYPFMMASLASLGVIYELVRASPGSVKPR